MNGQWVGTYTGTNTGNVVADLDDVGHAYHGEVFAYDSNSAHPRIFAPVTLPNDQTQFSLRLQLLSVGRGDGLILTPETLAQRYPGVQAPMHADSEWEVGPSQMKIRWKTDIGTSGEATLTKSEAGQPSQLKSSDDVKSWDDFKRFVLTLDPYRYAFRGHKNSAWRVRTSFYRTGRASLIKFMTQDIPALQRHLSGLTTHRFNLDNPLDYAAFLSLTQHHGYPTPILDWTQSPFVAAYFAFRDLRKTNIVADGKIRVLILDGRGWSAHFEKATGLMPGFQHMTLIEPLATNNPRALPQQSLSTVTNIDDLEAYISECEQRAGKSFLTAINLPVSERRTVMQDLALMGITAGSLFPGIEGACLQLKERFFDL